MRIHFFTDYFRPEPPPPAHHIAERARIWAAAGHDVTVVTSQPNYPDGKIYPGYRNRLRQLERQDGYAVLRVWTHVAPHGARIGKLLDHASYFASSPVHALGLDRPDVVVATSPHLLCGLAGACYARARRAPFLLEVRDLWPDSVLAAGAPSYRAFKAIERHIYRVASVVSVMTPAFEGHVLAEGARRAVTVLGGADLSRFTPGDAPAGLRRNLGLEGMFVVGYPGTLGTAHDTELLVEAAIALRDTRIRFLMIGGGPVIGDLERKVHERCAGMFRFVPTQSPESMPGWWRAMDAGLVLLRKTEAMRSVIPSKMFECMAVGKPVVFVGPSGAGSAVATGAGGGILVDEDGPGQLVRELTGLSADPRRYAALSANALKASSRYSRERQAAESLALLAEISGCSP